MKPKNQLTPSHVCKLRSNCKLSESKVYVYIEGKLTFFKIIKMPEGKSKKSKGQKR